MNEYYVRFKEFKSYNDDGDNDDGQYSYRGTTSLDLTVEGVYANDPSFGKFEYVVVGGKYSFFKSDEDIKPGEDAYLVYALYITGDTFGSDETWTPVALVRDNKRAIEISGKCYDSTSISETDKGYKEWEGYFEHLQSVEIEKFTVK